MALTSNLPTSLLAWQGAAINITANVATLGALAPPTGTIQFYDGPAAIGK